MMQRGRAAPERARGSRGRGDGGTTVLVGHRGRRGIRPGARAVRRVGLAAPAASGGLFPRLARLALAAGLLAALGASSALIYPAAVAGALVLLGAVVVASAAFSHAGGWHTVMTSVPPSALSLIRPAGDPGVPWPGLLFGIPVLGFYYWCTNQCIVQRVLSARTLEHGRAGALFAGFLSCRCCSSWCCLAPARSCSSRISRELIWSIRR